MDRIEIPPPGGAGELAPALWPKRTVVRSWIAPLQAHRDVWGVLLLCFDLAGFAACLWAAATWDSTALRLVAAVLESVFITRLFVIGHDACHGSLTSSTYLNRAIGQIAFLAPLVPPRYWELSHNILHHTYNNLKGKDKVWEPLSKAEFDALPLHRQWLERLYRGPLGPIPYYFYEMWWKILYRPPTANRQGRTDRLLVTLAMWAWGLGLALYAYSAGRSITAALALGMLLPFALWCWFMSFFVYVHHTHPTVTWYADEVEWKASSTWISATVHVEFPWLLGRVFHNIMEHPAHHTNMAVPCYAIRAAQSTLEARLPGRILVQPFTLAFYFDTLRRCKLYDYERKAWLDFAGNPT